MTSRLLVDKIEGKTTASTVQMPSGMVVQVVSSTTQTQSDISISAGTYADTGLTATITPKFSSSKILVSFVIGATGGDSTKDALFMLKRGDTFIARGSSGSYTTTVAIRTLNSEVTSAPSFTHLDSPSTTSATTYKVQGTMTGNGTLSVNKRQADTAFGTASSITLMEIAQ
jgi:hypothetical protein